MIKRKTDDYIRNYYKTTRNALLITGARQTGKTYSIHQSGRNARSGGIIQGSEKQQRYVAPSLGNHLCAAPQGRNARLFR